MLSDKLSLIFTGIVGIGIFIAGIAHLLDNVMVQFILGILFLLVVINLFTAKKEDDTNLE